MDAAESRCKRLQAPRRGWWHHPVLCCWPSQVSALRVIVSLVALSLAQSALAQIVNRVPSEVLLQGFNWESAVRTQGPWYGELARLAPEIAASGFTSIWLPPPSEAVPSVDQPYDPAVVDSRGYMPLRYYNLNSRYGSASDLKRLISQFKNLGVSPVADVVLNHRAAMRRDALGRWNIFEGPEWGRWAIVQEHRELGSTGGPDTGVVYPFAADLDHNNAVVSRDLTAWMQWLRREVGFEGWRYDFAKGYAGRFVANFNEATEPGFSVGEYWTELDYSCDSGRACYDQDAHRQSIIDWIDSTWRETGRPSELASAAFDFTTKGVLQYAIRYGEYWRLRDRMSRAPGLIGLWPTKAVTFIDNHDTGSTQQHWAFGDFDQVLQGYAYILTHPGTPSIFWDHFFEWGMRDQIATLMQVRRRNGLSSSSSLYIETATSDVYAAIIDGRVAMKLGPGDWSPVRTDRSPWKLTLSGKNFAVWEH